MANAKKMNNLSQAMNSLSGMMVSGQSVIKLKPENIIIHEQVRQKLKNIEELAESIKANDQQQPVVVHLAEERGKYVLEKGERRVEACRLLGIEVAAVVNPNQEDTLSAHAGQLVENIQRDDLEPLEIGLALQRFVDEGWPQSQIASRLGKSKGYVSLYLSLVKAPEALLKLYTDGHVRDPETINKLRQIVDIDQKWAHDLATQIAQEEGVPRARVRKWLAWAKEAKMEGRLAREYIAEKEAEEANTAPSTPSVEEGAAQEKGSARTERPGKDVGEGSLLNTHEGATTAEDKAVEDENAKHRSNDDSYRKIQNDLPYDEDAAALAEEAQEGNKDAAYATAVTEQQKQPRLSGDDNANDNATAKASSVYPIQCEGYQEFERGTLDIFVKLTQPDAKTVTARLLSTRFDDDDGYVWIQPEGGTPLRVEASDLIVSHLQPTN